MEHVPEALGANPWVALAYLVSGVLFILALRGLSHPTTSRRGNRFGMAGMAIAVGTTLWTQGFAMGSRAVDSAGQVAIDRMLLDWVTVGEIFAASVVAVVPIAILVFIFRKFVVSGLTSGAVKG